MTTGPADFRPTFATNSPETGGTVAAAINGLLAGMRTHLADPPDVAIASAYFNPGGFALLAAELEHAGAVRLLLGAEPATEPNGVRPLRFGRGRRADRQREQVAADEHLRAIAIDRDLLGFTHEADANARRLVAWLRSTAPGGDLRVNVRLYRRGFLHGKAFIVDTAVPHVLSGSSNFTYAGLATNSELNLGQYIPQTVHDVRLWFDRMWDQAETFDLAGLYEERWVPHDPWHVFLRMLYEAYGSEVDEESATSSLSRLGLTGFQADGVWRAKRVLAKRRGVIIADEVGLGKTFIAGELIYEATIDRRQKVLVVAPATLRDSTWTPFLREKNLRADVISFEELASDLDIAGRVDAALQHPDEYAMVVVDEAHALRNAVTKRAEAMRTLLRGRAPKDLVLMTATPVNNSLYDLYNLISYFSPSDAAFADSGIPSLRAYFDRAMAVSPDELSPEHLFDVIDQVAVRRTRRFVKHHYVGDKVRIAGVEQEIRFPTPRVRRVDYDLDLAMPGLLERLAKALGSHQSDDDDPLVLVAPGEVLSLARYLPSRFRLSNADPREQQYEAQNAGLLRSALLKRFESSAFAFRRTLEKMIASHERFLSALDAGLVLTGGALREWAVSDSDDVIDFLANLTERSADNVADAADFDAASLRGAVEADMELLHSLHQAVRVLAWNEDPKVCALVEALAQIAAEAEATGIGPEDVRNRRKVLLFSYFADTVEHLDAQVRIAVEEDDRLAAYRGRIASASGPDRRGRAQVLAAFAPTTAGTLGDEDLYDLLIATDVLSEGVNLQQAQHIINYDLPWNPMRLVQRHGRIDRIGSPHAEVFLRCYFPDRQLEALLGLEERLQWKLKQAAAATGVGEVLPGFIGRDVNFTESRVEIERLRVEEAALFEDGGASALSGEEYRRTLQRELASAQTRQAVLSLPWASGAKSTSPGREAGFVFCMRIADHPKPWFRFVPVDSHLEILRDELGAPTVIDDLLSCLAAADPGGQQPPEDVSDDEYRRIVDAAVDAFAVAREHAHDAWMFNADPANLAPVIPRALRDAAELVRSQGAFLGERQDELVARLEAPYAPRIQRDIRAVTTAEGPSAQDKVTQLQALADELGLTAQAAPDPLPPIEAEDIHLVCWLALMPAAC